MGEQSVLVKNEEKSENVENGNSEQLNLLRSKLELQTKVSANLKQKYQSVTKAYHNLEKKCRENEVELKTLREKVVSKQKELDLSRGVMHELKKLSMHSLHELELNLLSSLQKVQKQKSSYYDCRVCMINEKDNVLIPCGHFLCSECVLKVNECP